MKSVRVVFLVSGIITVISLGVVAFLMFWGPDRIDFAGKSLPQLLEEGDIVPIIVIPIALIIAGVTMLPFLRIMFPDEIKNGVNAQATVLKVWDTGVSINDNPQVGLLLQVSPAGSNPFQVEAKTLVSRLNVALVQPGVTAKVRYDPQKPKRLKVLTLHILQDPAAPTGAAARLEELNGLRDKGLISEAEYRQKREEILKAL
jgi:hypothetical protein